MSDAGIPSRLGETKVWEAAPWIVAFRDDVFYCRQFPKENDRELALQRLVHGESPEDVFESAEGQFPLSQVQAVEWVQDTKIVQMRMDGGRLWWTAVADEAVAKRLFRGIAACLPGAGEPVKVRGGLNDLPVNQYAVLLPCLLIIAAICGLFAGAVEGEDQAHLQGPAAAFSFFTKVGAAIGLVGAIAVTGAVVVSAGAAGLVWSRQNWPSKLVVRANRDRTRCGHRARR
jgi:hypothetical protein